MTQYRRLALRPKQEPGADQSWEDTLPAPERDSPDVSAEHAEMMIRYRKALAALPPEQRDVFLLYEESGLSLDEIAAISGVGMETAKSRLRYAVSKLRSALGTPAMKPAPAAGCAAVIQEPGL